MLEVLECMFTDRPHPVSVELRWRGFDVGIDCPHGPGVEAMIGKVGAYLRGRGLGLVVREFG